MLLLIIIIIIIKVCANGQTVQAGRQLGFLVNGLPRKTVSHLLLGRARFRQAITCRDSNCFSLTLSIDSASAAIANLRFIHSVS